MYSTQYFKKRKPVVAGQFYPAEPAELKALIAKLAKGSSKKIKAIGTSTSLSVNGELSRTIGCVLPHAGYIYSGYVAAQTLAAVNIPETILLIGPNHTGMGTAFSIMSEGVWQTPLGEVEINAPLAQEILKRSKFCQEDFLAHTGEHSLEVELPLLQYFRSDFKIVPIIVSSNDIEQLKSVGNSITEAISGLKIKDSTLIIASSDMTHYEPLAQAQMKDQAAIEAILALDEDKLIAQVRDLDISMCGCMPVIVMLRAAKLLGAKSAELIKYQTSAEASADKSSVVGYAGIVVKG